jgi:hypothetical protein
MVKLISTIALLIILLLGCKDPNLIMPKRENSSNKLSLNGYYYLKESGSNTGIISVLFLYQNGILLHVGGFKMSLPEIDDYINTNILNYNFSKNRLGWGVYIINNFNITFERWYPSSGGPMPVYVRKGNILNDSTFIMLSSEKQNGKDKKFISETYHFRAFSPKPDSTNNFIK